MPEVDHRKTELQQIVKQMGNPASMRPPPPSTAEGVCGKGEPRLRIAVLAACPFPANHGTPGSIRELSEATAERGHEVHVITYHFGDGPPPRGVQLQRIPDWTGETAIKVGPTRNRPLYDMLLVYRAIQVVRKHKLDVIHAHGYEAAIAAALCRLFTRRPVVYSAHNTMGDELASYDFFRFKWMANSLAWLLDATVPRMGNRCIPHSKNVVSFLQQRGLEKKMEPVVPWGIDLADVATGDRSSLRRHYGLSDQPVIMYTGVLDQFQRLDLLIDGFPRVVQHHPEARLVFVVTVPCEKQENWIRERARQLGIEGNVLLTEPQDMRGAQEHLSMADITVVPRPQTPGFPIKLMNYMATRRPCVLFESSACGAEHGRDVWQVTPDSPDALADGIIQLIDDPQLRQQLGQNAFEFVRQNHDRRQLARNVCSAYLRALEGTAIGRQVMQRDKVAVEDDQFIAADTNDWNLEVCR